MGQKSFGGVKTPARAALGNITNRGRPEGGGTQMSARKPGLVVREDAPGVARTPAPSVKKAGAETFWRASRRKCRRSSWRDATEGGAIRGRVG